MIRWQDQPWATPDGLMATVEALYRDALQAGKITDPVDTAVRKLIHYRNWCSAVNPAAVRRVVEELEVVYVPKGIGPGPGICFPIRDVTGEIHRLHVRLLEDGPERFKMKYMSLADDGFEGAAWAGSDDETLRGILDQGEVLLVEGPLDLVAVRILGCPIPSLCPLSKRMSRAAWDYLRVMQTRKIYTLFDVEPSGQGEKGAKTLQRLGWERYGIATTILTCPAHDPSDALKSSTSTYQLRALLGGLR